LDGLLDVFSGVEDGSDQRDARPISLHGVVCVSRSAILGLVGLQSGE
jgi:hypothetical protein